MINLMSNEFKKIFSKKSTYVIFLILILMLLGINGLKKYAITTMSKQNIYYNTKESVEDLKNNLERIEKDQFVGIESTEEQWRYYRAEIDRVNVEIELDKIGNSEWKKGLIYMREYIFDGQDTIVEIELDAAKNEKPELLKSAEYLKAKEDYAKSVEKFIAMTEDQYTDTRIASIKEIIAAYEKEIKGLKAQEEQDKTINNWAAIKRIEKELEVQKHNIKVAEIRKDKKIPYEQGNYMTNALQIYDSTALRLMNEEEPKETDSIMMKRQYYQTIKDLKESEYVLETGQDIRSQTSGHTNVKIFLGEYKMLYIVVVLVIAGTIVAEEYNKGTIKNLLVKPYKRTTILLSKLYVIMIISILAFLILLLAQTIIAGTVFDFKSMLEPVVQYNIQSETLEKINLFVYVLRDFVITLPYILVFLFFTFALSAITTSSATAITLGMVCFLATDVVNEILTLLTQSWVKYIPTLHWNWGKFIDPTFHESLGLSLQIAIPITIATWLVFLIPSFIVFNKRDIRNI